MDELTNLGLCDLASSKCEVFSVYGDNFIDSVDLKCHYKEAQVSGSQKFRFLYRQIYVILFTLRLKVFSV